MPNKQEIALYGIIAAIVIAVVAYVLLGSVFSSSYNISVKLSQTERNVTYPYQTSHYILNITNKGRNDVGGLLIGYYLDGVEQNTTTVSIPAGQSIQIVRNYTYPTAGPYTFEAVADPGHILDLVNRSAAQRSVTTNVTPASLPNVYTSLPNNNITLTQSFNLGGYGMISASAMAQRYNVMLTNRFFGPAGVIVAKVFQNIYPFTANAYGTYDVYTNNTIAYSTWLQGTVNPQIIGAVISSFGAAFINVNEGKTTIGFTPINNSVSMCVLYSDGWTKIVSYYNATFNGTCLGLATVTYAPNESLLLTNAIKQNPDVTHFQSGFIYTNSPVIGSALTYQGKNLTATNIFENNYGLFISSIRKRPTPLNISTIKNATCYGLIYYNNGTSICSYIIPTRTGNYSLPYGLINTTYVTSNYMVNIYSLVNNTQLVAAHNNAVHIISLLGINESSLFWNKVYNNMCSFGNQSIGCNFLSYERTANTTLINISVKNKLPGSLKINSLNCELVEIYNATIINKVLGSGDSSNFTVQCRAPALAPTATLVTTYIFKLNYTYNSTTRIINGTLNVTNQ